MDLDVQAVLERFRTLPNQSRRDVYNGILNQLRRDEWREVKERADKTSFECDILGKLPIEIVSLIAARMNLADLLVLQRVSRRWQEILSSPTVQWSAIQAATGHDLAAQNHGCTSSARFLKKRVRMERGQPTSTLKLRSPFSAEYDVLMHSGGVGYFNNIYAWLDGTDGRTTISLLNLRSGKMDRVTTENREQLSELNISERLVAALSIRGYCHVWDLETLEHKAFRLASLSYRHFLISGVKILISFNDYAVHWGFDSEIARSVNIGPNISLLALHPVEDQFTVAHLFDGENSEDNAPSILSRTDGRACLFHLRIDKYVIGSFNHFNLAVTKTQKLPFEGASEWIGLEGHYQYINRGQSSILLNRYISPPSENDVEPGISDELPSLVRDVPPAEVNRVGSMIYFTLDTTGDDVDVHLLALTPKTSSIAFLDQNLIYASGEGKKLQIFGPQISTATAQGMRHYHPIQRLLPNATCEWVYGDKDFVVLVNMEDVEIWSYDENWQPAEIRQT